MEPTFPNGDGNGGFRPSAEGLHPPYLCIWLKPRTVRGEPFEYAKDMLVNPFVVSPSTRLRTGLSNHERALYKIQDRPSPSPSPFKGGGV